MRKELRLLSKRIVDIVLSILITLILSPLFFLVAILVKLTSKGPVFFRHARVGKNEVPFQMWKFRTMTHESDQIGPGLTEPGDSRISGVGKLLRRLSLDELPQLFNVMLGEMSLVGPRPEIPEIVQTYSPQQKKALSIRPGITGLSQISGRDDLPIDIKLNLEVEYVETVSMGLDFKILLKTIPTIINARGNRY
ncbi:MAG: sugar transferase [Bacteroidetes bacterium]|nr:MAG: sugar transferase [Bacteroidota bacterium]